MLEAAQIKPGEVAYDLGCGDARIVITAARKFQARAVGVEISDVLSKSTANKVMATDGALKVDLGPPAWRRCTC